MSDLDDDRADRPDPAPPSQSSFTDELDGLGAAIEAEFVNGDDSDGDPSDQDLAEAESESMIAFDQDDDGPDEFEFGGDSDTVEDGTTEPGAAEFGAAEPEVAAERGEAAEPEGAAERGEAAEPEGAAEPGEAAASDTASTANTATEPGSASEPEKTPEPGADSPADPADDATAIHQPQASPAELGSAPPPARGTIVRPRAAAIEPAPARRKTAIFARFLSGSLIVIAAMAAATAIAALRYAEEIANKLGDNSLIGAELTSELVPIEVGEPQTILILGTDHRDDSVNGNSDTAMLVRLDPEQQSITVLSIPRDFKAYIPGYGYYDKINAAYSLGGRKLAVKTITRATGIEANHLVEVDFEGFGRAVDAIDCVYIDADRQYYNPPGTGYAPINVNAGYQRLCGEKALEYVRFRHLDNDLVRAARQQDFVREARQRVPADRLAEDRNELVDIFTDYTSSDISDSGDLIELFKLFNALKDAPVRQLHFGGKIGPIYVTASKSHLKELADEFLNPPAPSSSTSEDPPPEEPAPDEQKKHHGGAGGGNSEPPPPAMVDSGPLGVARFANTSYARLPGLDIYYPTEVPEGTIMSDDSRQYGITGYGREGSYAAYKLVLYRPAVYYNEYFGVMGTEWMDPPILVNPSETRKIGDAYYDLFYDGDRLRMISWQTDSGSYWINNTLLQSLDESEMIAMAESIRQFQK